MIKKVINGVHVTVDGDDNISDNEIQNYIDKVKEEYITNYKHQELSELTLTIINDDDVKVDYKINNTRFERIRRITGYLVGSLDKWNDAKQKEEKDRVKHDLSSIDKKDEIASILGIDMIQNVTGIERDCNNQIIHQEVYEPVYAIA